MEGGRARRPSFVRRVKFVGNCPDRAGPENAEVRNGACGNPPP